MIDPSNPLILFPQYLFKPPKKKKSNQISGDFVDCESENGPSSRVRNGEVVVVIFGIDPERAINFALVAFFFWGFDICFYSL